MPCKFVIASICLKGYLRLKNMWDSKLHTILSLCPSIKRATDIIFHKLGGIPLSVQVAMNFRPKEGTYIGTVWVRGQ